MLENKRGNEMGGAGEDGSKDKKKGEEMREGEELERRGEGGKGEERVGVEKGRGEEKGGAGEDRSRDKKESREEIREGE